jgi:hypothetical protein
LPGSFETTDAATSIPLKTLRVPVLKHDVWSEAKNMASDLPGWKVVSADDTALTLVCERDRGVLGGRATVTITVSGPDGVPSSAVHVKSVSRGGWISRDKANVAEFMRPFHRRVC